jgi:hypothetical protein
MLYGLNKRIALGSNPLTITQSLLAIIDKNQLPKHYGGEADEF